MRPHLKEVQLCAASGALSVRTYNRSDIVKGTDPLARPQNFTTLNKMAEVRIRNTNTPIWLLVQQNIALRAAPMHCTNIQ